MLDLMFLPCHRFHSNGVLLVLNYHNFQALSLQEKLLSLFSLCFSVFWLVLVLLWFHSLLQENLYLFLAWYQKFVCFPSFHFVMATGCFSKISCEFRICIMKTSEDKVLLVFLLTLWLHFPSDYNCYLDFDTLIDSRDTTGS